MGLGSKMHDGVDTVGAEELVDQALIANIPLDKDMPLVVRDAFQVLQAASVSQRIQVDDV